MWTVLPLVFVLCGAVLYVVLGGADFGAGIWHLLSGPGARGQRIREHAHHSMGPVWEANHVWLIFILTVSWTAYPAFVGSMASTLALAFLVAGLGIILRGATYALRTAATGGREMIVIDGAFAVASLITPFALGAAAGGVAALRVPYGNARGSLITSWLNPVGILIGALAVVFSSYLAAVYLAADANRRGEAEMVAAFRTRALINGLVAGALAAAGLAVISADAPSLYSGLIHGAGLAAIIVSGLAGAGTLGLVATHRFELARVTGAVAVAAVISGWALARYPLLLPGLTVQRAAAPHDTLVAVVVAIIAGGVILFPALGLLFSLTLRGQLGGSPGAPHEATPDGPAPLGSRLRAGLTGRVAVGLFLAGLGLLNVADTPWMHGLGVVCFFACIIAGFAAVVPAALAADS